METQSITTIFEHLADAESAVGRLEVAGVPVSHITIHRPSQADARIPLTDRTVVTAFVEARLIDKAMGILTGDGRVDVSIAVE